MLETCWDGSVSGVNKGQLLVPCEPIVPPPPRSAFQHIDITDTQVAACCPSQSAGAFFGLIHQRAGLTHHQVEESLRRLVKAGRVIKTHTRPARYRRKPVHAVPMPQKPTTLPRETRCA